MHEVGKLICLSAYDGRINLTRIEGRPGQKRFPVGTNTKSPRPSWPAMWMGA
jgi:hypothetical protein